MQLAQIKAYKGMVHRCMLRREVASQPERIDSKNAGKCIGQGRSVMAAT